MAPSYDNHAVMTIPSTELVPGDLLVIKGDTKLPCDAVLLHGQCTVNEAMLTGETTVVIKQPVSSPSHINDAETRNTLFGGSLVVQLRVPRDDHVLAVVVRTGFETVKGRLVLSILYPKVPRFKFMEQSLMFVGVLFLLAMAGFGVNAKALSNFDTPIETIVQRGCDMVTIVVPPALPLALTVGIAYALIALRRDKIFCISPPRVNLAGKINCFCFDKTGTLTTEGLELQCLRPSANAQFDQERTDANSLLAPFQMLMATCHSLTHVKGVISGDPLELQTFAFTGATMAEPHTSPSVRSDIISEIALPGSVEAFTVLRQFEFVPALQRMGCLVRHGNTTFAVVKGSPEMMYQLCSPETLPPNFNEILDEYTHKGLRVLAAGYRTFDHSADVNVGARWTVERMREEAEQKLTFLGLIVLENKLKPETVGVIRELRTDGAIPMHMITGDNAVAAVCVARACTIVEPGYRVFIGDMHRNENAGEDSIMWRCVDDDSVTLDPNTLLPSDRRGAEPYRLAMTGKAYMHLNDKLRMQTLSRMQFSKILINCTVFARMSPENKASVVERLQETGLYVGMIGDGANDSLALRAAHVGISLSQVEASVSAPFTSMIPNIACIPRVLCEGRGSLATSFCLFQFMALYSTIQFTNAVLIVFSDSFLSNNEYLYQDLFIVFILALTLGSTPSARKLTPKRPSANLLSLYNLTICFGFIAVTLIMQGIVFLRVQQQSWYNTEAYPASMNEDDDEEGTNSRIPETTTVFLMAMLQYVAVAIIFSIGYPWKLPTYTNCKCARTLHTVYLESPFSCAHR
jgi:cation-transporting ATPase 13A2